MKTSTTLLTICLILWGGIFFSHAQQCGPSDDIVQNSTTSGTGSGALQGQTFEATCTGPIEDITVFVESASNNVNPATIELYLGAFEVNSTPIATATEIITTSSTTERFDFSPPVNLVAGQIYSFLIKDTAGIVSFQSSNTNPYPDGVRRVLVGNQVFSFPTTDLRFIVGYEDNEPPNVVCMDATLSLGSDGTVVIERSDIDGGSSGGISFQNVVPNILTCDDLGENEVTLFLGDSAGNIASCEAIVTIVDDLPPVANICEDITVNNDPNRCTARVDYLENLSPSDNCGIIIIDFVTGPNPGDVFPIGATEIEYLLRDPSGNSTSCSFTITVVDNEPPAITPCEDIIVNLSPGECTAIVNYTDIITVSDNCGIDTLNITGLPSGSAFPIGDSVIEYEATDINGLTSNCSFTITVEDTNAPVLNCPADVTIDCADTGAIPFTGNSTEVLNIPDENDTGITSTATISTINPDFIIRDITVEIAIEHTWVGDLTIDLIAPGGESVNLIADGLAESSDLSSDHPITFSDAATIDANQMGEGGLPNNGVICQDDGICEYRPMAGTANNQEQGVFKDFIDLIYANGSSFDGDWTLQIVDGVGGDLGILASWQINMEAVDLNASPTIDTNPSATGMATATDNCSTPIVTFNDVVVDGCGITETITRTWTATDEVGNETTCVQTITVTDTRAPELISCPEDIVVELAQGETETTITYDLPEAVDICGDVTITQTAGLASGELFPEGVTTNTFSITDACGNEVICSFTVTVTTQETLVSLDAGVLTIEDVGSASDDDITFSDDGTMLTISNLTSPVDIQGAITEISETSVTVALANISNGIILTTGGGTNTATVTVSTATTALDIQGDDTATIALDAIDTGSMRIEGFTDITDVGGIITVAGATTLTASNEIVLNDGEGNHEFNGPVTLDARRITFSAGADLTFGEVTITATDPLQNFLIANPGTLTLDGNITITDINTNLFLAGTNGIVQQSGIINSGFLILQGTGSSDATLDQPNTVNAIAVRNPVVDTESAFTNVSFTNATNTFLANIIVDEFTFTAPQFDLEPGFTEITKNGTGESTFNANIDINTGTGTAIFNHNAGTISFNGNTNDFNGRVTYNGAVGTVTNLNSDVSDLPVGGPDRSFTFGTLNGTGTIDIGDIVVDILDTANFSGANTLLTGFPLIQGGVTTLSDNATITPGGGTTDLNYNFDELVMNTGATFAPHIISEIGFFGFTPLFDSLTAEDITLDNANLAPTGGFIAQLAGEIIIVRNEGANPVSGTFNGLPEGASISFGSYNGIISYVGGDGNDITLSPDPDNLVPVLISEYQPLLSPSSDPQTIEIFGAAGSAFEGTFVVIEGDFDNDPGPGVVVSADTFTGTFDANGLLITTIPNINNPSHTVVLTTSFTGIVDTGMNDGTDIDTDNDGIADDLSAFGLILDAVGLGDGGVCCPVDFIYGIDFGGVDLPDIGGIPEAIFREASDGDFFQISNTSGNIFDNTGTTVNASLFDTTPTSGGTFGNINPIQVTTNCSVVTTWDGTTWDNGTPDASVAAVINGDYDTDTDGNIIACEFFISAGFTVNIQHNGFMDIQNDITVNGSLIVTNEGSIVQREDMAIATNNGTIQIHKTTPLLQPRDFILLGSPMTEETNGGVYSMADRAFTIIEGNFVPNTDPDLDAVVANFIDDNGDYLDNMELDNPALSGDLIGLDNILAAGNGYLVFPQAVTDVGAVTFDHTYTQGTLNNGIINRVTTYNGPATSNNFNLLGNPYASAIDVHAFIMGNNPVNEIYYWEHITQPDENLPGFNTLNFSMDDVSVRNLTGGIASMNGGTAPGQFMVSGQGFAILADQTVAGTDVTFNNSMRTTGNNSTPRSTEQDNRLWLQMTSDAYTINTKTLIGFLPEASPEFDFGYDSDRMHTSIGLFSTLEDGSQLSIQGREVFDADMEIGLGITNDLPETLTLTISIDRMEGIALEFNDIFLIDHLLNTVTDLKTSDYSFTAGEGIQNNRFTVVFEEPSLLDVEEVSFRESDINLYPNPATDQVTLSYGGGQSLIQAMIVNVNGKVVRQIDLDDFDGQRQLDISTLRHGMYFVQIQGERFQTTKKLIVK